MKTFTAYSLLVLLLPVVVASALGRFGAERQVPTRALVCIPVCPDAPGAVPTIFGFAAVPSATAGPAPTPMYR
jgi:hypothetical protein